VAESLHTRLLAATSALTAAAERTPEELAAANRAVLELHRPVRCNWPRCVSPLTHLVCEGCGSGVNAEDCSTIQVIAEALGVKDEVLIEKEGPTNA